jgi:hypothetical protein
MTVINFALLEDGVYVVADTLATTDRYEPGFFTSKVHPVPHLNGLICGTGSLGFILDWSRHVLGGMLALDIGHLDEFTPNSLRDLHAARPEAERLAMTSTIYHLGFDDSEDRFVGYAYRSTDNFDSERLEYGTRLKPGYSGQRHLTAFPDDFVEACREQRLEQDALPLQDRVFIGGHIVAYMLQVQRIEGRPPSVTTSITRPFEFEDFEAAYMSCVDGLTQATYPAT